MLEVNNIDADIGPTQILRSVNLNVTAGSMCGLIGRNGAGKTTVMRTIMGLLTARNGTIMLDGEDLVGIDGYKRAPLGIGYMPEDRRLVPQLTTEENILLPVWATKADNSDSRLRWIFQLMPEVEEFRHRRGDLGPCDQCHFAGRVHIRVPFVASLGWGLHGSILQVACPIQSIPVCDVPEHTSHALGLDESGVGGIQ